MILQYGTGRDQGIYLVVARVMQAGWIPYRNAWDFKPPGIFLIHRAALVFRGGMLPVRAIEALALVSQALAFAVLTRRFTGSPIPGALGGALAALIHVQLEFWHTARPESFGGPVLAWPLVLATNPGNKTLGRGAMPAGMSAAYPTNHSIRPVPRAARCPAVSPPPPPVIRDFPRVSSGDRKSSATWRTTMNAENAATMGQSRLVATASRSRRPPEADRISRASSAGSKATATSLHSSPAPKRAVAVQRRDPRAPSQTRSARRTNSAASESVRPEIQVTLSVSRGAHPQRADAREAGTSPAPARRAREHEDDVDQMDRQVGCVKSRRLLPPDPPVDRVGEGSERPVVTARPLRAR